MLDRQRKRQRRQEQQRGSITIKQSDEDLLHLLNPPRIDDELAAEAFEAAKSRVEKMRLLRPSDSTIPSLTWMDIRIHRILGVGSFGAVSLVRVPKLDNISCDGHWYALKCLNKDAMTVDSEDSRKKFIKAARDLYTEAALLSCLRHKNIIKIHGVVKGSDKNTFQQPGGYFMVLQCMKRTLDEMLRAWENDPDLAPSKDERVSKLGMGIANAMEYLHENQILYLDLKPHNVGLDYNGNVRLFDFGIAKELPEGKQTVHCCVGSLRYMAPELLILHEASMASDVYAFGILLWQLVALKKPYGDNTSLKTFYQEYREQVGSGNARPEPLPEDKSLCNLMQASWNQDPAARPPFSVIVQSLKPRKEETCRHSFRAFLTDKIFSRKSRRRVMHSKE